MLADLDENDYKDSTLIMELLRENLILWNVEEDAITGKDVDEAAEDEVKKDEEQNMDTSSDQKAMETSIDQKEDAVKIVHSDLKVDTVKIGISDLKEGEKMEITQDSTEDGKQLDVNMDVAKEVEGA
jgi:hypothetical protein